MSLLLQEIRKVPNLKILFATRPERHIRNILLHYKSHQMYQLHDIENSIVEGDVTRYLRHELSSQAVKAAPPRIRSTTLDTLLVRIEHSCQIFRQTFIIASTAIKFLLDDKRCNPKAQMMDLMQAITIDKAGSTPLNTLDSVCTQILSIAIPSNSSPEMLSRFHCLRYHRPSSRPTPHSAPCYPTPERSMMRCRKRRQSLRTARNIFIYTFITLAGGSQPHRTS